MVEDKVDGGTRWHENIAIVKLGEKIWYVWLLQGPAGTAGGSLAEGREKADARPAEADRE